MHLVSRISMALAICSLATLLSFVQPPNPGKMAFGQEDSGTTTAAEQVIYGPKLPGVEESGITYGPTWPVEAESSLIGPKLPDFSVLVLNKAKSLMGLPYRFGGNDPNHALDCSSYVQLVFKEAGLDLPRVTYDQFKLGQAVPQDQLKPGDLLFFSTNGPGPSHIGIYAGNGEFIHESPPGVQVTRLDNPGYQKHFIGARRVLN